MLGKIRTYLATAVGVFLGISFGVAPPNIVEGVAGVLPGVVVLFVFLGALYYITAVFLNSKIYKIPVALAIEIAVGLASVWIAEQNVSISFISSLITIFVILYFILSPIHEIINDSRWGK